MADVAEGARVRPRSFGLVTSVHPPAAPKTASVMAARRMRVVAGPLCQTRRTNLTERRWRALQCANVAEDEEADGDGEAPPHELSVCGHEEGGEQQDEAEDVRAVREPEMGLEPLFASASQTRVVRMAMRRGTQCRRSCHSRDGGDGVHGPGGAGGGGTARAHHLESCPAPATFDRLMREIKPTVGGRKLLVSTWRRTTSRPR